jgi:hypothetical protein
MHRQTMIRPLDRYPLVRTQNADELRGILSRIYAEPKLSFHDHARKIDVAINHYSLKDISIGYTRYGTELTAIYPETDFALQSFPLAGSAQVRLGRMENSLNFSHGTIVSPGASFAIKLNARYEHLVLVIHKEALIRTLSILTGVPIKSTLNFIPARDYEQPALKTLREHFFFLVDMLNASGPAMPNVVLAEFEQTLVMMFLHANRHNYSHLLEHRIEAAGSSQVRRAEEYIEANAQRSVTQQQIAEVTGVSLLSLNAAFRKYRGYSPQEFLSWVRSQCQAVSDK